MFNRRKKKRDDKGIPCPTCMQIFSSVEEIKIHFEQNHSDQNGHDETENQGEGFLCPVCKKSLSSPEMLQSHYDAEHNEDTPTVPEPSHAGNGEITGVEIRELRKKLELLQSQLQGSEESRTLLSSEVFQSEQKVSQFSLQIEAFKLEKEVCQSKADQLAAEIVTLKANIQEEKEQKQSLEEDVITLKQQLDDRVLYAKNLEIQLAERPEADAIVLVQQELKMTNTIIDRITQEREKEKEELEKECKIYKAQCIIQEAKVEELMAQLKEAPKPEDVLRFQLSLSEKESDVKSLRTSVEKLESDLAKLQDGRQKLLDQLEQMSQSVSEGQTTIVELQEQLSCSGDEKRNLQNILLSTQNDLLETKADLAKTRNKLLQSSQLLEEHVSTISHLQTAVDEKDQFTLTAQQETERARETNEELKNELETVKSVLNTKTKELEDYLRVMGDCESSSQSVLLQKDQEISEITLKLEKLQVDLNMKFAEISDLQNEMATSSKNFEDERQQNDNLKAQLMEIKARSEDEARKLSQMGDKVKDLEGRVLSLTEEKQRLENVRQDLVTKIDSGDGASELIHQMNQENSCLQGKLLSLESALQAQVFEHFSKEESLHVNLQEVRGQLQESESKMSKLESTLEKKSGKLKRVQQKLLEIESDLKEKSELLLTSETAKSSQKVDLENRIKTANISVEKTTAHLSAVKSQLDLAGKDATAKKEKVVQLESKLHEQKEKLFQVNQKVNILDRELKEKSSKLAQIEAEKREMEDMVNANNQLIVDTKGKLVKAEQDLEVERKSKTTEIADLSKKLKKLTSKTEDLQQTFDEMSSKLAQVEAEKREMEDTVKANNQLIVESKEKLVKAEQALEMERRSKTNEIADFYKKQEKITVENAKLQQTLDQLNSKLAQVEAERREMEDTVYANNQLIVDTKVKLVKAEQALEVERRSKSFEMIDFSKKIEKLTAEKGNMQQKLDDVSSRLVQAEAKKREMEDAVHENNQLFVDTKEKLVKVEQDLEVARRSKTTEKADCFKQLEKITAEKADLQQNFDVMVSSQAEMERTHAEKIKELENALRDLANSKSELKQIQESFSVTRENCDDQLIFLTTQFENDRKKADGVKEELVKQVSSLTDEVNSLKQDKITVLNQIMNLTQQLQQSITERDRTKGQLEMEKMVLQAEVKILQKNLDDANAGKDECKNDIIKLKNMLEVEQESKQQKVSDMMAAKDLILQQKMEVESRLLSANRKLEQRAEELVKTRFEAEETQKILQQEKSILTEKLAAEVSAFKHMQIEKDEYEKQSSLIGDNLTTLRSDLMNAEASLEELTTTNVRIQKDNLELQARLDRGNDERRLLIERCESSESNCERLMENIAEQNFKLEDFQAALQELGRENQTLQITTTKVQGRKWTEDNAVTECLSCDKVFSVLIRKHHCRSCGHIFCNECSSKVTQIPLRRKSGRVCDPCYRELQVQKKL